MRCGLFDGASWEEERRGERGEGRGEREKGKGTQMMFIVKGNQVHFS
jgi:hypothetical protein